MHPQSVPIDATAPASARATSAPGTPNAHADSVKPRTPHCWIAVASAEHARRGRDHAPGGYMQVCHGKVAPLQRVSAGDVVAYYAPATQMRGGDRLQSFVSIGVVQPGMPYTADMGGGFVPWRRNVAYVPAVEAPIAPLLPHLRFIDDPRRWGYKFRFGLFEVGADHMRLIASAMQADLRALRLQAPLRSAAPTPWPDAPTPSHTGARHVVA